MICEKVKSSAPPSVANWSYIWLWSSPRKRIQIWSNMFMPMCEIMWYLWHSPIWLTSCETKWGQSWCNVIHRFATIWIVILRGPLLFFRKTMENVYKPVWPECHIHIKIRKFPRWHMYSWQNEGVLCALFLGALGSWDSDNIKTSTTSCRHCEKGSSWGLHSLK